MAESGQPLESIARAAALKAARPSLLQNPSQTLQRHAVVAASLKEFVAKLRGTATGERAPLQESRSRTPGGDMRETIDIIYREYFAYFTRHKHTDIST